MAVVQSGFIGAVILHPDAFGISQPATNELSDYVFFWRGIGYLLGIDDEYNICTHGLEVAQDICRSIETEIVLPGLYQPPSEFHRMTDAYIEGMNGNDLKIRMTTKESVIAFSISVLTGQMLHLPSWLRLNWSEYFRIWLRRGNVFLIKWCPGYRRLLNWLIMNVLFRFCLPLVEKQLACRDAKHVDASCIPSAVN
jgi:hypothetical protein